MEQVKEFNDALAFEFANAPEELKQRAIEHRTSHLRAKKAREQFMAWKKELTLAEERFASTFEDFNSALQRWDQDSNTMKQTLEEIEVKSAQL